MKLMNAYLFMSIITLVILLTCSKKNTFVPILAKDHHFMMGSKNGLAFEKPIHNVIFTYDFAIMATEVTQKEYVNLIGTHHSFFKGNRLPVENVSWYDAILYCNALSKKKSLDTVYEYSKKIHNSESGNLELKDIRIHFKRTGFRLPFEAEWEYACRGGTTSDYFWGDEIDITAINHYSWYDENSMDNTHPVGTKKANSFGLYDMNGNVFEWCNDWFSAYAPNPSTDPKGPPKGSGKVIRGGGWYAPFTRCRSSFREAANPSGRGPGVGFRIAKTL